MTHLPDSDLRELEGLLGKATPGPWRCISTQVYGETFIGQAMTPMDAALIVAMRSALPSLIADLREVRERIEWQPIESAPRDQAILLLGPLDLSTVDVPEAYQSQPMRAVGGWDEIDSAWAIGSHTYTGPWIKPTHWMPLPDAPDRIKEKG